MAGYEYVGVMNCIHQQREYWAVFGMQYALR